MSIYCPQCGSQRLSADVRFCSRCGFNLANVEQLVATGGLTSLPVAASPPMSPRRKGIRFGAKILFASVVTFPLFFAISIAGNSPGPLAITFILFLLGASRMAYARMFEDEAPAVGLPQMALSPPQPVAGALPSYRAPVSWSAPKAATTGELQAPPSVTEHTTNLLERPPGGGRVTES